MESGNPLLDDYVLGLAPSARLSWEGTKVVESKLAATVLEPRQNGGGEALAIAEFRRLRRATSRPAMRGR